MGHEQREEVEAMLGEADDQDDREAHDRQYASGGEMAGEGKGVKPHQTQRQQAQKVSQQNEHEERKDVGDIFAPLVADIRNQQILDEAGHIFDRHLPATGDQFALHAADHEDPQHHSREHHIERAVGEGDVEAADRQMIRTEQRFDRKLMHRIDFAGFCHAGPLLRLNRLNVGL